MLKNSYLRTMQIQYSSAQNLRQMLIYSHIGLKIPEQIPPQGKPFFVNEKDVSEWVESLPSANIGETSRRLFQVLQEFNHTTLPYKKRLTVIEKFRDPVSHVGASLNKHYIDVGFPLTDKAKKTAFLNQELHKGLATSYKSAIVDLLQDKQGRPDHKLLTTAIHRTIYHLSRMMLLSVLIYENFPKRSWLELHILHRLACRHDLESFQVKDPLEANGRSSSIDEAYRRTMLFCLASPYKIRQRENIQLFDALLEWAEHTRFYRDDETASEASIIIQQDFDVAPCHGAIRDKTNSKFILKLDVSELIHKLRKQFDSQTEVETLQGGESLDQNLLRQLIQLWSTEQKRSFMRTKLNFELNVAVGISNIYQLLKNNNLEDEQVEELARDKPVKNPEKGYEILSRFTLEPLETENWTEVRRNNFEDFGPISRDPQDIEPILPIWGKSEQTQRISETFLFQTLNESAGGYCLDWRGEQIPKILVGELIGIQSSMSSDQFGIGLIRWMKSTTNESMQVGVQMIAPDAIAIKARKANQASQSAHEALLLPEVGTSGQPTSFICPAFPFKVGDLLTIDDGQQRKIKLTRLLESSGAISQFQFIHLDQSKVGNRFTHDNDELGDSIDFGNLWSTL